jgi:type I restriction enzyme S subunit
LQLSEKLSLTDNIDTSIEREIGKCEVLRQSILKMAFSGKLAAQDQNDEPASILLERIRAKKAEKENGKKITRKKDAA